ncbi:hypothetical protein I4U23_031162 [Adineta vaga]|nr:hypothetical protein I4U23_031162 [Adineta vaga]
MVYVPPSIVNLFPDNTVHKNVEQRIHGKRTHLAVDHVSPNRTYDTNSTVSNKNSEHNGYPQIKLSTSTSSFQSNQLTEFPFQAMSATTSSFQINQLTDEIVQPPLAIAGVFQNYLHKGDQYSKSIQPTDKMIIELLLAYESGLVTAEESLAKIKSIVVKDNATSQ